MTAATVGKELLVEVELTGVVVEDEAALVVVSACFVMGRLVVLDAFVADL
jgi:hypothetical protein